MSEAGLRYPEASKNAGHMVLPTAARLFRAKGFNAVSICDIAEQSGVEEAEVLAKYASKEDLFIAVLRNDHPLLRHLCARTGETPGELWDQMLAIFSAYLDPKNFDKIRLGCSIATLTRDVAIGEDRMRRAYDEAHDAILVEMVRDQSLGPDDPSVVAAFTLAFGATASAAACSSEARRTQILNSAANTFNTIMAPLPMSALAQG